VPVVSRTTAQYPLLCAPSEEECNRWQVLHIGFARVGCRTRGELLLAASCCPVVTMASYDSVTKAFAAFDREKDKCVNQCVQCSCFGVC